MNWPKQAKVPDDRILNAPFNFVPLAEEPLIAYEDEKKIPGHGQYDPNLLTGHIDLQISTETLLYTRCAYTPEYESIPDTRCEERQQFFHHGDKEFPVIPGSSIRGMLRSLVEIIGYGKMTDEHIFDELLVYRDVAGTSSLADDYREQLQADNIKAGYLHWAGVTHWIQPAREHVGLTYGKVEDCSFSVDENGIRVWVIPNRVISTILSVDPKKAGYQEGILFLSGSFRKENKYYVVFEEDSSPSSRINIPDTLWQSWGEEVDSQPKRESRKVKEGKPVFYLLDSSLATVENPQGLMFWGPTRYFRLPYPNSVMDFVPEQLKNKKGVDFASAIFGSTERAGRVQFGDAKFESIDNDASPFETNDKDGRVVLKILSSPQPTSFQEYLVQPLDASIQNTENPARLLLSYHYPYLKKYTIASVATTYGTLIRGHKTYWNKPTNIASISENDGWNKINIDKPQNTVIRPVRPGCRFFSRISFENLRLDELGALLTALRLKDEGSSRHRLGMGKPYGMGRVKIASTLTLDDRQHRYKSFFGQVPKNNTDGAKNAEEFFTNLVLQHHNGLYGANRSTIWNIPRLADLVRMLEKTKRTDCDYTDFSSEMNKFKERFVLPAPAQLLNEPLDRGPLADRSSSDTTRKIQQSPSVVSHTISNGNRLSFIAHRKGNKWKFKVKDGIGEGSLQPNSPKPELENQKEYVLEVISSGNNNNKGMMLKWQPED